MTKSYKPGDVVSIILENEFVLYLVIEVRLHTVSGYTLKQTLTKSSLDAFPVTIKEHLKNVNLYRYKEVLTNTFLPDSTILYDCVEVPKAQIKGSVNYSKYHKTMFLKKYEENLEP